MSDLKDKIASYVIDYPRFEESANEVADLILLAVREHDKSRNDVLDKANERLAVLAVKHCPSKHHDWEEIKNLFSTIEKLKHPPVCDFCSEKEIWDERLNLCHACAKEHYS